MTASASHPDDLLPWLANDSLDGEERSRVEAHLADCERCRGELALLTELREQSTPVFATDGPGELGLRRLRRDLRRESGAPNRVLRYALAAAAVLLLIETATLTSVWTSRGGTDADAYRPLSGGPAAELVVRFQPDATAAQIEALLGEIDAEIVEGPGAFGLYRLDLGEEVPPEILADAFERLSRSPAVAEALTE